jgi:hypothetical protein
MSDFPELLGANQKIEAYYQMLYRTTDSLGNATATMTSVLVPYNANMSQVLNYQSAGDATYINCAPSYAIQLGQCNQTITQVEILLI